MAISSAKFHIGGIFKRSLYIKRGGLSIHVTVKTGSTVVSCGDIVVSPYSVKIHGIHYKSGAVVRIKVKSDDRSDLFPFQYATIKNFYIYKDHKIICAQKLHVIDTNVHIRGIQVKLLEDVLLFRSDDLFSHGVLHLKQQGFEVYLIEKDNRINPTFFY